MTKLNKIGEQIKNVNKLTILEAKKMYEDAIKIEDENKKNKIINEIIKGTLYVIYNYIKNNRLYIFDNGTFDEEDLFQSYCEEWAIKIKNGALRTANSFSNILNRNFVYNVNKKMTNNLYNENIYNLEYYKELLKIYINLRNNSDYVSSVDMINYMIEHNLCKLKGKFESDTYPLMEIELIYKIIKRKLPNKELNKKQIDIFIPLLINLVKTERINYDYQFEGDIENESVNKLYFDKMINIIFTRLTRLTEKEKFVISEIFGLEDGISRTQKEIASEIGLSDTRILHIKKDVFRKIRCNTEIRKNYVPLN